MTSPEDDAGDRRQEDEALAELVGVLQKIGQGDYSVRAPQGSAARPVLRSLARGINELLDLLDEERNRAARALHDVEEKSATVELQLATLRALSSPIIEIWHRVLCLPVVGVMDRERGVEMRKSLLVAASSRPTTHALIDITGIDGMDSAAVKEVVDTARAVRLLGVECILTGVTPAVAQTMAAMQLDLGAVTTMQTLHSALAEIIQRGDER